MKKFSLILFLILLFPSCDKDDSEDLVTQNATIFIDKSEVDNCLYTIETENNRFFYSDDLPGEYSENIVEARITYKVTKEKSDCIFSGSLIKIKILKLVEI